MIVRATDKMAEWTFLSERRGKERVPELELAPLGISPWVGKNRWGDGFNGEIGLLFCQGVGDTFEFEGHRCLVDGECNVDRIIIIIL